MPFSFDSNLSSYSTHFFPLPTAFTCTCTCACKYMYVHVCCTCAHMYMYTYCVHAHLHVHVCAILFSLFLFLLPSLGYPGYSGPSYGNTQLKCLSLSLSSHHSFPSDPYPEGFRASPDFRPDVFNTYHGQEVHHRGSSPPPWFVREGDMVTSNLHAVSDQVHVQYTYSTCTHTVHVQHVYIPFHAAVVH